MRKILVIGGGAMGSAFTIPCIEKKNDVTITEPHSKRFIKDLSSKNKFHSALKIKLPRKLKFRKFSNELLKEKLFKHILISDYQLVSEISVTNVKKKHSTILKINTLEVDGDINDDTFTEINLKRFEKFNQ